MGVAALLLATWSSLGAPEPPVPIEPAQPTTEVLLCVGAEDAWYEAGVSARPEPRPVRGLERLSPGDRLVLGPRGALWALEERATLVRAWGPGSVLVDTEGRLSAAPSDPEAEDAPQARLERRDLGALRLPLDAGEGAVPWSSSGPSEDRCGAPPPRVALWPHETAVLERRPVLQWDPGLAGSRYTVELIRLSEDGAQKVVERWTDVAAPGLQPFRALDEGAYYRWSVEGDGQRSGLAAWIHVPTEEQVLALSQALEAVEARAGVLAAGPATRSILRALTLEAAGALDEAEQAWAEVGGPLALERLRRLRTRSLTEPRARQRIYAPAWPDPPMCRDLECRMP